MRRGFRLLAASGMALMAFFFSLARLQGFQLPSEQKGTLNAEILGGGIVAQHDSSTLLTRVFGWVAHVLCIS